MTRTRIPFVCFQLRNGNTKGFCSLVNKQLLSSKSLSSEIFSRAGPRTKTLTVMMNDFRCLSFTSQRLDGSIVDRGEPTYYPSSFEKRVLVWTKFYAKVDDIPEKIQRQQIVVAKDKFRIIAAIWFMVAWGVGAAVMIAYGKRTRSAHLAEEAEKVKQMYIRDAQVAQEAREKYMEQHKKD